MAVESIPIDVDGFVEVIFKKCYQGAQQGSLSRIRNPPGRMPDEHLVKLHGWFEALSDHDQEMVALAMSDVADGAIFRVLTILDNVSPLTDRYREEVRLKIVGDGVERDLVADPTEELHGIFRSMVDQDRAENQAD